MTRFDENARENQLLPEPDAGKRPTVMLAAFEGWNDAGEAASDSLNFLAESFAAETKASMDADDYYDFQFTRPVIGRSGDGEQAITWPDTRFATASAEGLNLVFAHGIEPSYRWQAYTGEFFEYVEDLDVDVLILVGALLADVPHTRPIPVSATSEDAAIRDRLGIDGPQYEGPVGIVGVLSEAAKQRKLPSVSLWAAVPHYVSQSPSPKAQLALLHKLEELLRLPLQVADLAEEAQAWERGVNELAAEDPDIAKYVKQLEEAKDTAELPEASGESIAREFERYLRRRGKEKP